MGCGWEVLRRTRLVVCYGVDLLVLWVSHIHRRILQIQSDCGKKMMPFHAIWGLWWYNFVEIEIPILDVRILLGYRSHLFHHHVALQKEGQRHLIFSLKMGPWVTRFASRFELGFSVLLFLFSLKKKKSEAHGDAFLVWRPTSSDLVCRSFFNEGKYVEDNLGLLFERLKNQTFFFFLRPPPFSLLGSLKDNYGILILNRESEQLNTLK